MTPLPESERSDRNEAMEMSDVIWTRSRWWRICGVRLEGVAPTVLCDLPRHHLGDHEGIMGGATMHWHRLERPGCLNSDDRYA